MDVKLDMELDMKASHGRAREEREACARGGDVPAGARTGQPAAPPGRPVPGPVQPVPTPDPSDFNRVSGLCQPGHIHNKRMKTLIHRMQSLVVVLDVVTILVVGLNLDVQLVDMMRKMDWLTLLRQGVKTVDEYYMEMEMLMQCGRVRESLEMIMQRFLNGLKYDIKGIVRHYNYTTMNQLLHHAREAESQMAEEAKVKGRATGAGRFMPRVPPSTAPAPSMRSAPYSTPSSKPVSNVSNAKTSESTASSSGSSMSTARNRDMACHTCGGKGHFKRDCPNRKVMIINEDNEYETGDDVDPNAPEDDDYDTDGEDAYPSDARTIVVSQRALNVLPSASTQRCNLFQTKALVGPNKACKVIIDGGSCRNLASKELCTKLKLKYLPHPHPYYIQWLSDNGEMKIMASPSINFNQFLEKEKLKSNGSNFTDWFRHPRGELQKRFELHDPCDMINELKVIFETHAAVESYEVSKQFFGRMMEEGSSVSEHVFAMSGHAKKLSDLGIIIPNKLGIHRVLQSLPPSYKNFVMNYNMQNMNKELPERFSMLKSAEVKIQKEHQVLMVNKTTKFKKQGKPEKDLNKGGKLPRSSREA
ncbi:hypothetical protein QYE76_028165 [Lolium multiflorum]|uniref:CCHC-type domain-containing protein n=1 Tax=Lolium multiflorum TaxID=4521 RepID=A0AAD8QL85_LOLMU|nr:hypothetical protein QYE76_028165 [Lolium multiflorum]